MTGAADSGESATDAPPLSARYGWLIPTAAAVAGSMAGVLATIYATGFVEAEKATAQRRSEALAAYLEAAWGGAPSECDGAADCERAAEAAALDFTRKLSLLSVYGSEELLRAVVTYHSSGCIEHTDAVCRAEWAKVVNAARFWVGEREAPAVLIGDLLWGAE